MLNLNLKIFFLLLAFHFQSKAHLACRNLFEIKNLKTDIIFSNETTNSDNYVKVQEILSQLNIIGQYSPTSQNNLNMKHFIEDIIYNKNFYNNADLALNLFNYIVTYNKALNANNLLKDITSNPKYYNLMMQGKTLPFSNPIMNSSIFSNIQSADAWSIRSGLNSNFLDSDTTYKVYLLIKKQLSEIDIVNEASKLANDFKNDYGFYQNRLTQRVTVPDYNIFKAIKTSLKSALKGTAETYQEILVVEDEKSKKMNVIVISSQPIEKFTFNKNGAWIKVLETLKDNDDLIDKTFNWNINGNIFQAIINLKYGKAVEIKFNNSISPNYHNMLKDQNLTGMVIVSQNLSDFRNKLISQYSNYLLQENFKLEKIERNFKQIDRFILEKAEKNEIDYIIKEGHKESTLENMFLFNGQVEVYKFKKIKDKLNETIYIVAAKGIKNNSNSKSENILRWTELGNSLRKRKIPQELLYYDASCFAQCNVQRNLKYVAADGFIPVAGNNFADTFVPKDGNVVYEFLNGIRNKATYAEIRERIKQFNQENQNIIFPDQGLEYINPSELGTIRTYDLRIDRFFKAETP